MSYLIVATLPQGSEPLFEGLVQTASSFLGTGGAVQKTALGGAYRRQCRATTEFMKLVELTPKVAAADPNGKASTLERVLRAQIVAAEASGEVRVFVSEG